MLGKRKRTEPFKPQAQICTLALMQDRITELTQGAEALFKELTAGKKVSTAVETHLFRVILAPFYILGDPELDGERAKILVKREMLAGTRRVDLKVIAEIDRSVFQKTRENARTSLAHYHSLIATYSMYPTCQSQLVRAFVRAHAFAGELTLPSESSNDFPTDVVADEVANFFAAGTLSFPFKKYYLSETHVHAMFTKLQSRKPAPQRFEGRFAQTQWNNILRPLHFPGRNCFMAQDDDYWSLDLVTDFFTEPQRMQARLAYRPHNLLDLVRQRDFAFKLATTALKVHGELTSFTLRESMWGLAPECTQFKVSLAVDVFKTFKAQHVLDMSAGWGDRLCGAMAAGVRSYVGFDPNQALEPGHSAMVQTFNPLDALRPPERKRFQVRYEPFETSDLSSVSEVDVVFSSPPFFNFEIYADDPTQSVNKFKTFAEWLTQFLFASLAKCWAKLRVGGHVVLHMSDAVGAHQPICEPTCLWAVKSLPGCSFLGALASQGHGGKARPLWVFHKR